MKKIKLLFQGDSITDAGRDYENIHDLGRGYPKYASEILKERHPEIEFEFIDLGISGNQTKDLVERIEKDFIDIQPDIVLFEERYRIILNSIKNRTNAKLMMIEPFLIPINDKNFFREDLNFKIDIIRKLAREYADVYLPTDGLLHSAFIGDDPLTYAADGVHPTAKGAEFIGKLYADYIEALL